MDALRQVVTRRLRSIAASIALPLAAGCGEAVAPDVAIDGVSPPATCPQGQIADVNGGCFPVGIQGCAAMFVGPDGLCHPTMAACPAGTIPRFDEGCVAVGITGCAPEFIGDDGLCRPKMTKCPPGTFAAPQRGCVSVDGPEGCGTGTWGDIPVAPGTIYVDPSYPGADGDGSQAAPVTTVTRALFLARSGARVALAEGVYDETLIIAKPVELVGRCPSKVIFRPSEIGDPAAVIVVGGAARGTTIRGIQLAGGGVGIVVLDAAPVVIDRVHVLGAFPYGVFVSGPESVVTLSNSRIEGTRRADAGVGVGVLAREGATVSVVSSAVIDSDDCGLVAAESPTTLGLSGSLVEGTRNRAGTVSGFGALLSDGAQLALADSALVSNEGGGVDVSTPQTSMRAVGVLIEGPPTAPGVAVARSVFVRKGGSVTLDESVVLGSTSAGVFAFDAGTVATVRSSLIQDTRADPANGVGSGIVAVAGALLTVSGSALWHNQSAGMFIEDPPTEAHVDHTLVEASYTSPPLPSAGQGLGALNGRITLDSSAFVANSAAGLFFTGGTDATMTGMLIEGTMPGAMGFYGRGLEVSNGAVATLIGGLVTDNLDIGVSALMDGSVARPRLTVQTSLVQNTVPRQSDGGWGVGIFGENCVLDVASTVVRNSAMAGVAAFTNTSATLQDTRVDGVVGSGFIDTDGRRFDGLGDGVLAAFGSTADLDRVTVTGCSRAGILYESSAGTISNSHASDNRFGLVLQGAPLPDVHGDNVFTNNLEQDRIDGNDLPVPTSPPPVP